MVKEEADLKQKSKVSWWKLGDTNKSMLLTTLHNTVPAFDQLKDLYKTNEDLSE